MKYSPTQEIRFLSAIKGHCITEKAERAKIESQQFLVEIAPEATKKTVKQAIQWLFDVNVEKICTINVKGKTKQFKQAKGKRKNWKKAYICLKSGQTIDWSRINKG